MAIEAKRGCGYRKVGGLYLVGGKLGLPCCKMPIVLNVCPTCGGGVKQTRGWTWIDPRPWIKGECITASRGCVLAGDLLLTLRGPSAAKEHEPLRVGLLWIGAGFYKTPEDFIAEADSLGISRRITAVPRGFRLGESWVFLAHPRGFPSIDPEKSAAGLGADAVTWLPAVFRIFKPERIEKIITASQAADAAEMEKLSKAGVTPVVVPDDDPDHQGTVYDDASEPGQAELPVS